MKCYQGIKSMIKCLLEYKENRTSRNTEKCVNVIYKNIFKSIQLLKPILIVIVIT